MREWHYKFEGQEQNTVQEKELISMIKDGLIPPETLVWTEGMTDWAQVNQIDDFIARIYKNTSLPQSPSMSIPTDYHAMPQSIGSTFFYIPISRLIIMSILSCGLYEVYWIYKNWKYLKERDGMRIRPFWRGFFGIFFCHRLLTAIYQDNQLRHVKLPNFSPNILATVWVLLIIVASIISKLPYSIATIIALVMPSFLCFVPVQRYINSVNAKRNQNIPYSKWSTGHIVCLIIGLLVWVLVFFSIKDLGINSLSN